MRLLIFSLMLAAVAAAQNPMTASFPGAVATDTTLGVTCNSARSVMTSALTNSTTDLSFTIPSGDAAKICVPSWATLGTEVVKLCAKSVNTFTICSGGRAVHGNLNNHAIGESIVVYIDENVLNQDKAEIKAIQGALGPNLGNVLTPGRDLKFSGNSAYDIGDALGTGKPRDVYVGRNLNLPASGTAVIGDWLISGAIGQTSATAITLDTAYNGRVFETSATTAVTLSIPSGLGKFSATFWQGAAGKITVQIVSGSGVALLNPDNAFTTKGTGAPVTITCLTANKCYVGGYVVP